METTTKRAEIESALRHFSGSQEYFRHWTQRLIWTEGVNYLAEAAGAFWLIDVVASYQGQKRLQPCDGFQFWELAVDLDKKTGVVTCRADSDTKPLVTQSIEFTDFPLPSVKLYCEHDGEKWTLLLPDEH